MRSCLAHPHSSIGLCHGSGSVSGKAIRTSKRPADPGQDRSIALPLKAVLSHWSRPHGNVLGSSKSASKDNGLMTMGTIRYHTVNCALETGETHPRLSAARTLLSVREAPNPSSFQPRRLDRLRPALRSRHYSRLSLIAVGVIFRPLSHISAHLAQYSRAIQEESGRLQQVFGRVGIVPTPTMRTRLDLSYPKEMRENQTRTVSLQ